MKKWIVVLVASTVSLLAAAQHKTEKSYSIAFTNSQTAMPFGKFSSLLYRDLHPGLDAGIGFNWKTRVRHDWFQEFHAGYFYHRFVQHGIPVYTHIGYRYKFGPAFSAAALLGVGYLHSIPATAQLKLNDDGEYRHAKGIGRMQAMAHFSLRLNYRLPGGKERPLQLFGQYQQLLQLPFVKSYVPLLPYNVFMVGVTRPLRKK